MTQDAPRPAATRRGPTLLTPACVGLATLACVGLATLASGAPPAGDDAPQRAASPPRTGALPASTFSIVAFDAETGDLGVAVESKFFGVGPVVPFAAAGVGAVATQSFANTTYGPRGLELLRQGMTAAEAIRALTEPDEERARRQVGIVDARGNAATYTGEECLPWAGGLTGEGYAVQGNILAGPQVVEAMAAAFEAADGDLATRLVAALAAGQAAGGDARGRQSAALLVVREGGGYRGFSDRYIDLRVDDHPAPIRELQRLLDMRHGQLATARARRHLREAETAREEGRQEAAEAALEAALEAAREATRLYPHDEWAWMTLASVHLQRGETEAAGRAAIRALETNPWVKTALVKGLLGPAGLVEALLEVEAFRSLWESVPVQP